jgi:integrase
LRWGEIRRLRWENIDLKNGWVQLRAEETKARRDDVLPLAPDLAKALKKAARPAGLVFASSPTLKTLQRDLKRAKIEYETERGQVDRKSLRKTFGTHLARAGVELQTAVKLMRHSDPKLTLNIYTDPMLLDMKAAVERIGGQGKNRR